MAANTAPTFGGSLDNAPTLVEGAGFTALDPTVTISDAELNAAGNYLRASVTIQRSGAASLDDSFGLGSSFQFAAEGGVIALAPGTSSPGLVIGTVTRNSRGVLTLTFNNKATQTLVNLVLSQVTYRNTSNTPPASVNIDWVFSDGNKGAQGTGGAQTVTGSTTVNFTAVNDPDRFGSAGTGNDVISGNDAINSLNGLLGNDVLYGAGSNDSLNGDAGDDELYGEDGSDSLIGGKGADALDGGIGFDSVSYSGSTAGVIVDLTLGKGQRGDAQGDTYVSIEAVEGSASDDEIIGNGEANRFFASWGNDTYDGRGGPDLYSSVSANWSVEIAFGARAQQLASLLKVTLPTTAYGIAVKTSADQATLAAGPTYDLILDVNNFQGGSRNDTIAGNDANNTIFASFGTDVLSGGDGFDYIVANGSNVIDLQAGTLTGTATTATLTGFEAAYGSTAIDTLLGNADANRLEGRGDNDNLAGRGGNDHLLGGDGNDLMRGEAGNDILEGGAGGDLLDGGQGIDWASYLESDTEVQVDLLLGRGGGISLESSGDRYINVENVVGSEQDDTIVGNNSDNILVGDKGSDDINGCGGDDVIYGDVYPVLLGLLPESEYLYADGAINPICGCVTEEEDANGTFTIANMIDDLQGGDGDDRLFGQGGTDLLRGDRGDDFLSGGNQLDLLFGGDGDDTLDGGGGADFLFGDAGFDIASYATSQAAVSVDLSKPFSGVGGDAESDLITELLSQVLTSTNIGSTFISASFTSLFALINSALDTSTGRSLFTLSDMLLSIEGLTGSKFADHLTGDAGDNILKGGLGADVLDGGLGVDLGDYQDKDDSVSVTLGGAADVTVFVDGVAEDTIRNIEDLAGGSGADTLTGDNFRNFLYGAGGNDTLAGGNGNDQLMGGAGKDTLDGNAGVDTADYSDQVRAVAVVLAGAGNASVKINGTVEDTIRNIENVQGGTAADSLSGDDLDNILAGGAGADALRGAAGTDVLDGEDGSDTADYGDKTAAVRVTLKGASNATVSVGGGVEDTIRNIENLIGGTSSDTLIGDGLDNRLVGGLGDDTLQGGAGKDALDGGDGIDTADYRDKSAAITATLRGASNASVSVGGIAEDSLRSIENLFGGSGQDELTGDTFANMLNGNGDDDSLAGAGGDDVLAGGAGDDVLAGGAGNDSLTGGVGLDGFLFDAALDATTNLDTVADFNVADDSIALAKTIFTAFVSNGAIDADAFFVGAAAHDASDRIIYNSLTGSLFYDSNGTDAAGGIQFAQLATGLSLTNQDFIVVT